jgi:hypothetical protein
MAKIDTSKIEGYESMSAEEKLKALEDFEFEDNADELEKQKGLLSKANSEAADWKKKYNALSKDGDKEKKSLEEKYNELSVEVETLRKANKQTEYVAALVSQGFSEDNAKEAAAALIEGDMAKYFECSKKHNEGLEKDIEARLLKNVPRPPAGDPDVGMTKEKFMKLSPAEKHKFSQEHPEEYKAFYNGGNT